jgi:hypothetical protein
MVLLGSTVLLAISFGHKEVVAQLRSYLCRHPHYGWFLLMSLARSTRPQAIRIRAVVQCIVLQILYRLFSAAMIHQLQSASMQRIPTRLAAHAMVTEKSHE